METGGALAGEQVLDHLVRSVLAASEERRGSDGLAKSGEVTDAAVN